MTEEFHVSWKGQTAGPFTRQEIEAHLRSGEITPLHAIRRNGELIDAARWLHSLRPANPPTPPTPAPEPTKPSPPPAPIIPASVHPGNITQDFSKPPDHSRVPPPPPPPDFAAFESPSSQEYQPPSSQVSNALPLATDATQIQQRHDIFAVLTFATAMVSILVLPIVFVPICLICSIVSYYRLKDNPNLKGNGLRLTGAIIGAVSLLYLLWNLGIFKI
jgi:hypothetical protein